MDTIAELERLPADIDAHPLVEAAVALRPVLRQYHDEIEREQRMPPALVGQLREAGFYRMVIPRSLGGLQVDTLTYLRVVEKLAEGCGSVGWNLGNGGVTSWPTPGCRTRGSRRSTGNEPTRSSPGPPCRAADRQCRSRAAIGSAGAGSSAAAVRRPPGCWG